MIVIAAGSLATANDAAACTWNAALAVTKDLTHPSSELDFDWAATPSGCMTFTLDHYRVVYNDTAIPTSITDGDVKIVVPPLTEWKKAVHRAQRTFYAKVYACDDTTCTDKFGDGAFETITAGSDDDSETTDQEVWVVTGVEPADTGVGVVQGSTGAPSGFFRPTGWTNAGKLQVYYDASDGIYTKVASTSGWQDFNSATWGSATRVAANHDTDASYDGIGHADPFPVLWGTTKGVQLLAQNNDGSGFTLDEHVVRADSSDEDGDDFSLTCATCCDGATAGPCDWPTEGLVEICADGTSTCYELVEALHGRWTWDQRDDGVPDLTADNPQMLFSGWVDNATCSRANYGSSLESDVYSATWDQVNEVWEVDMTGSCPTEHINDAHDPGIIPLPGDEFKVYVMTWDVPHQALIYYWDGTDWESQTATPLIEFDDAGGTDVTDDCIGNFEGTFYIQSGANQGLLFDGAEDGASFAGSTCTSGFADFGIYFAELTN